MTHKVVPRSGRQWLTVECPVLEDGVECARPVEVKVCVQTYPEWDEDGHMSLFTDYDLETITAPCGHIYVRAEEQEALYESVKQAVLDGED